MPAAREAAGISNGDGQGLAAQPLERFTDIDATFVDRFPDDNTGDTGVGRGGTAYHIQIGEASYPSGDDHPGTGAVGKFGGNVDVRTRKHAVTRDVGIDEGPYAGSREPRRDAEEVLGRILSPSAECGYPPASIEPDGDPLRSPSADGSFDQFWAFDGSGPDNRAIDAAPKHDLQVGFRAQTSTSLYARAAASRHFDDQGAVRPLAKRRIEVDHVDPLGSLTSERGRLKQRIRMIDGFAINRSLLEADTAATSEIDRGIER
jgi:hypothetical protein